LRGDPIGQNPARCDHRNDRHLYNPVQQTKVNELSEVEGEALLTRYPVIETGNLDHQTRDTVALVARVLIEATPVDVYVTHLFISRGDDPLRLFQVEQLLAWVGREIGVDTDGR
jgi:endonuclease/exonuclease/phosphatase family metal-dependent hydrolase